jgi:hypothetical protein
LFSMGEKARYVMVVLVHVHTPWCEWRQTDEATVEVPVCPVPFDTSVRRRTVALAGRLYEMHELFARLHAPLEAEAAWVQATSLGQRIGLAWVQAARGLSMH